MSVLDEALKKASNEKSATVVSRERFYLSSGHKKKNWTAYIGMGVFALSLALAVGVFALEYQARMAVEMELESALLDVKKAQADLVQSERDADEMAAQYEDRLRVAEGRVQGLTERIETVVREKDAIEFRSTQKDNQISNQSFKIDSLRSDRTRLSRLLRRKSASVTS